MNEYLLYGLIAAVLVLAVAVVVLAALAWRHSRWRRRINKDEALVLPDGFADRLDKNAKRTADVAKVLLQLGKGLDEVAKYLDGRFKDHEAGVAKRFEDYGAHIEIVEQTAADRAEELKRYKDGYDLAVNRSLILGVIGAIDFLEDSMRGIAARGDGAEAGDDGDDGDDGGAELVALEAGRDRLVLLLEANGVELYAPPVGEKLMDHAKDCEPVARAATKEKTKNGLIAGVQHPGYRIAVADGEMRVVREAQVSVYAFDDPKGGKA